MLSKKYFAIVAVLGLALVAVLVMPMFAQTMGLAMGIFSVVPVFAQSTDATLTAGFSNTNNGLGMAWGNGIERGAAGIFGTVSAISGSVITVTGKSRAKNSSTTTYTVNAGNATVIKNGASSSVAGIAVGDSLMIQGAVNGTTITATAIRDNIPQRPGISGTVSAINGNIITVTDRKNVAYSVDATSATVTKNGDASSISGIIVGDKVMVSGTVNGTSISATAIRDILNQGGKAKPNPVIQGNGQPLISGSITVISGTNMTVTNKSNVTYSVDVSNAKFMKGNATSTLSNFAVGDSVVVQGAVNGNLVTASSVIGTGQGKTADNPNTAPSPASHRGFFGGIFSFFQNLFGF
jgi:hypothetical protein